MATGDLIALSDAKDYLGDVKFDNDEFIKTLITQASQMIKDELQTDVLTTTYTNEMHNGDGNCIIYLDRYPVQKLLSVSIGEETAVTIYHDISPQAFVSTTDNALELRQLTNGEWIEETLVYSDYSVMSDMFADISDSNWSYELNTDFTMYRPDSLVKESGKEASYYQCDLYIPSTPEPEIRIRNKEQASLYDSSGFTKGIRNVYVSYVGGWVTVPEAIRAATCELVKFLYEMLQHDSTLTKEELGEYSYSAGVLGNPAHIFQNLNIGLVKAKLNPFKRLLIG